MKIDTEVSRPQPAKVLGVLGGMGPAATVDFLSKLTRATPAACDQEHIASITCSFPGTPDRTHAILERGPTPLPDMLRALEVLQQAGTDCVAIPCSTAHFWYAQLQGSTSLPIIHIVDAVIEEMRTGARLARQVGLLATTATVRAQVYTSRFSDAGIDCLVPNAGEQEQVMSAIRAVKAGISTEAAKRQLATISSSLLTRGAELIILGCTELPLLLHDPRRYLDATDALARSCIRHFSR